MNYHLIHDRLIERARNRKLDGYVEKHHILPGCKGGLDTPENLVELTAREHYIIHVLLAKIHPDDFGLLSAAKWMASRTAKNSRIYQKLREDFAKQLSQRRQGVKRPPHVIAKWTNKGLPVSQETRNKMAIKKIGTKATDKTREKMSRSHQMNHRNKLIALSYQIPF